MATNPLSVQDALAAYLSSVEGIKLALTALPIQINTPDLPLIYVTPDGGGKWEMVSTGFVRVTNLVNVIGLVAPLIQGQTLSDGIALTQPLLQQVGSALIFDRTLGHRVNNLGAFTDGGIGSQKAPTGLEYWGFQLKVPVQVVVMLSALKTLPSVPGSAGYVNGQPFVPPLDVPPLTGQDPTSYQNGGTPPVPIDFAHAHGGAVVNAPPPKGEHF